MNGRQTNNQSVKLPKVQTPNSHNQIQTNQLLDNTVKKSIDGPNKTLTNGIGLRIPTSNDSLRKVI